MNISYNINTIYTFKITVYTLPFKSLNKIYFKMSLMLTKATII